MNVYLLLHPLNRRITTRKLTWYAIDHLPGRVVATPVTAASGARRIDRGDRVLLGRRVDLLNYAQRQKLSLEVQQQRFISPRVPIPAFFDPLPQPSSSSLAGVR